MELLSPPKTVMLLDMGIETLHAQSQEWLSEIVFWEIELKFLYDLLSEKTSASIFEDDTSSIIKKENRITKLELKALKKQVMDHEKYLDYLITNKQGDELIYRHNHKKLAIDFRDMDSRYRKLKREIFLLVKPSASNTVPWNQIITTIYSRRSVRKYKDKSIDRKTIEQIIDAGRMAPVAMNKQNLKFYVFTSKKTIKELSAAMRKTGEEKYRPLIHADVQPERYDPVFYHAPVVIFITAPENDEWGELNSGMSAENIIIAAKSIGIDSCVIGAGKLLDDTAKPMLSKIPQGEKVTLGIVIGYSDEHPVGNGRSKEDIIFVD